MDRLFDRGYVRRRDIDDSTWDILEGGALITAEAMGYTAVRCIACCSARTGGSASPFVPRCADMDPELAACAVNRFAEANFSRINNRSGFLMGIIRRVKEDGVDAGSGDLNDLPSSVRHRLRDLFDDVRFADKIPVTNFSNMWC